MQIMKGCNRYEQCGAPLCPLDKSLDERFWYSDEEICQSRKHGNRRWVKKQSKIVHRQIKKWLDRPISHQELFDASKPRNISDAQKKRLVEMGLEHRYGIGH